MSGAGGGAGAGAAAMVTQTDDYVIDLLNAWGKFLEFVEICGVRKNVLIPTLPSRSLCNTL